MLTKYFFKKIYLLIPYVLLILLNPVLEARSSIKSAQMMDFATNSNYSAFIHSFLIVLMLFIVHGILLFITHVIRAKLVKHSRESLRKEMFDQTISTSNDLYNNPDTGYHIAAFSNDITILEYKYFDAWLVVLESVIAIGVAVSVLFSLNRKLALAIVVGEIASVVICFIVRLYSIKKNRIYIERLARFTQRIKDYFSSFQTIHNYLVENKIRRKFHILNHETEHAKDEADMALTFVNSLAKVCNSVLKFIVAGLGVVLMMKGEITIGLVYAAYQFCNQIISPMQNMIAGINSIESVKSIVDRVKSIFHLSEDLMLEPAENKETNSGIDVRDVCVTVNGNTILQDVTHAFLPGKKYLIIGKNGAGKSTLLKLLKKSTVNYEGKIFVDGIDLSSASHQWLSSKISYINETVSLICDTVKQNIVLYRDISDSRLDEIVKTVGLNVPLNRIVKDGERNLSSGETRRIEIARSLVNKAEVIVYDEAISTLDVQTAYSIEKMLLELQNQTVIFVSHNYSGQLISEYDEIILMESGRISDCGTHDELLSRNKYYQTINAIKSGLAT